MKNIRYSVICFFLLGVWITIQAQEITPNNTTAELGLRLTSLQDFGFVYKKQKKPNQYSRHRLVVANIALENISNENSRFSFGIGYAVGKEKRQSLGEKVQFIHGIEPAFNLSLASQGNLSRLVLQPAIGYVVGFQLDVSNSFYINIETVPALRANLNFNEGNRADTYNLLAGFSSEAIALTLAYRFVPKQ